MAKITIIGGGPAGLMAAETALSEGCDVTLFEAKPTLARKFLLAGKSGLNLSHSEQFDAFSKRYGDASERMLPMLERFTSQHIVAWANELGAETFVGSSGMVFPKAMKGSPLLRAWIQRLTAAGLKVNLRHKWQGFNDDSVVFDTPDGRVTHKFETLVLALGGASWPKLGSDAAWVPFLEERGVEIAPFRPANCGFDVDWSDHFIERFAGAPVKGVVAGSGAGSVHGEFVTTKTGVEGSLVYAHAAALRDVIERKGRATLTLDLSPARELPNLTALLARQNPKLSFSNKLRKGPGLTGAKAALLREMVPDVAQYSAEKLAKLIKNLPIPVVRTQPIEDAISVAGGVAWSEVKPNLMLEKAPSIFVAGEMLDWEAPTGGYLLTGCFATGRAAGSFAAKWSKLAWA